MTIPTETEATIPPAYRAPDGGIYVHKDLELRLQPWGRTERLGDLESWVAYVQRFSDGDAVLTWNSGGLRAQIIYPTERDEKGTWEARYPFTTTPQWNDWVDFADGRASHHREAVEFLEDHAADIVTPTAADFLDLLRNLRGNVNTKASADLRPDGTSHIAFDQDKRVTAGTAKELDLPPEFEIGIPVLKGDTQPWKLQVRLRVSVTSDGLLELRFSLPQAEQVLETVYNERATKAKDLLGDKFPLLRAAD